MMTRILMKNKVVIMVILSSFFSSCDDDFRQGSCDEGFYQQSDGNGGFFCAPLFEDDAFDLTEFAKGDSK